MNRLLLLAIAPAVKEGYDVLYELVRRLDFDPGTFKLFVDLKMLNLCVGIQPHGASHPCAYCHWRRDTDVEAEFRTFEGIASWHAAWVAAGRKKLQLPKFFNCHAKPLPMFPAKGRVIDHAPLPELHLLLGIVNRLFDGMYDLMEEGIFKWSNVKK